MRKTLAELAELFGLTLVGDANRVIHGVATLSEAGENDISFYHNPKYREQLEKTRAGAVIVAKEAVDVCPCAALVSLNPYLSFAQLTALFAYQPDVTPGIHSSAVIGEGSQIPSSVRIGPHVVIEKNVTLGERTVIEAGSFIGEGVSIGEDCRIAPRVTIMNHCVLGNRVSLFPGVVIGADGFGNVMHEGAWRKIPQVGRVLIADDVEIGANTTVDRGALGDTKIGRGVKLDNQIQIAHNVEIGDHTAIAACAAIAGSVKIGRYCMIGGGAGIAGHLEIADKTILTAMAEVPSSIKTPGIYSSGTALLDNRTWRKSVIRFRQLDELAREVKKISKKINGRGDE